MVEMKGPWDQRMGWQWECCPYSASGARTVQRRCGKGVVCQTGTRSLERKNEEAVPGGTTSSNELCPQSLQKVESGKGHGRGWPCVMEGVCDARERGGVGDVVSGGIELAGKGGIQMGCGRDRKLGDIHQHGI